MLSKIKQCGLANSKLRRCCAKLTNQGRPSSLKHPSFKGHPTRAARSFTAQLWPRRRTMTPHGSKAIQIFFWLPTILSPSESAIYTVVSLCRAAGRPCLRTVQLPLPGRNTITAGGFPFPFPPCARQLPPQAAATANLRASAVYEKRRGSMQQAVFSLLACKRKKKFDRILLI